MTYDISAVLLTQNDADTIERALKSVMWCDEVFIVDSQSDDRTRNIARKYDTTIIDAPQTKHDEPFDHLRRLAIDEATNPLILRIDSDEWFPQELQERIQSIVTNSDDIGVVRAPRVNYLDDKRLCGGRQWPDYQPILFDPESVTIRAQIHEWIKFDENDVETIPIRKEMLIQHTYASSLRQHFQTQRRYAKIMGNSRSFSLVELFISPPWALYHTVVQLRGYRDGLVGFALGLCWSWYHLEARVYSLRK